MICWMILASLTSLMVSASHLFDRYGGAGDTGHGFSK